MMVKDLLYVNDESPWAYKQEYVRACMGVCVRACVHVCKSSPVLDQDCQKMPLLSQ